MVPYQNHKFAGRVYGSGMLRQSITGFFFQRDLGVLVALIETSSESYSLYKAFPRCIEGP